MAFLNDRVLDNGLSVFRAESTRLDICSQEPDDFTKATATYTLGNATWTTGVSSKCGAPEAHTTGRKMTVSAITDGTVTGTGTAAYIAISDASGERLLYAGALSASQGVTSGNTFSLTSFYVAIPGISGD